VVAACSDGRALVEQDALVCVIAACKSHFATDARQWIHAVAPARMAIVASRCQALGVDLGIAIPKRSVDAGPDDCTDPLACMH